MNVELIKIPQDVAKAKLASYRKALAARHHKAATDRATKEYAALEQAYEVAAKGLPLIELSKAMALGGWDEQGRPRFAVHRADRRVVSCSVGDARWSRTIDFSNPRTSAALDVHKFPLTGMPARPVGTSWHGTAIVPMVPPDVLPRANCDLSKRVILWEADWQAAPVDPLLLLPIGGDLYAVEAAWDLTALERAVIEGRRTS